MARTGAATRMRPAIRAIKPVALSREPAACYLFFMRVWIAAAATAVTFMGCTPVVDPQLPPEGTPITNGLEVVVRNHYSAIGERQRLVIRDAQAWSQFWVRAHGSLTPRPDVPNIDFTTNIVVAAAMGSRPSGGYTVAIDAMYELESTLYAVVTERSPGAGCVTTAALTAPVIAVRVARPGAQVSFVEREEIIDC